MQNDIPKIDIWAETEAEITDFLLLCGNLLKFNVRKAYVAKRTGGKRNVGDRYLQGVYFPYDINQHATLDTNVIAPKFITDLVQWCSPDIILATDNFPLITIETTYHNLTYNNVAQRIPRMIKSATLKIPSVIFQKTDYTYEKELTWFTETFFKASKIYRTPCLVILFNDIEFNTAKMSFIRLINACIASKKEFCKEIKCNLLRMKKIAKKYDKKNLLYRGNGKKRNWIDVNKKAVTVSIGVRDNCALTGISGYGCQGSNKSKIAFKKKLGSRPIGKKGCVWLSKGTGGMDPYPGLIKMSEILLCYDKFGNKKKKLISIFSCLPKSFWWFKKYHNEIYYRLIREFSDRVIYAPKYS